MAGLSSLFGAGSSGNSASTSTTQNPISGAITNNIGGFNIPPVPAIPGNLPSSPIGSVTGGGLFTVGHSEMLLLGASALLVGALVLMRKKGK